MTRENKALLLAAPVILTVVYNVFVFTLFRAEGKIFWTTYAFTMTSFALSAASVAFQAHRRGFFLSWPLLYAALAYPAAQLAASFAFMALPGALSTAAPLTQTAILAAFLLCLVSALFGGGMIADVDKQQKAQTFFIKTLAADLSVLAAQAKDPGAKKKLEALHETARYSDPVSHAALSALEAEISAKARTLAQLAASGGDVTELCEQTALLLGERNAKCGLK